MSGRIIALIVASFGVVVLALSTTGVLPADAMQQLFRGSLGSPRAISNTLRETTPLLIAGVAVFLALRAGLFNIGVEGQLVVGALSATAIVLSVPGPLGVVLGVVGASAAGAAWAYPAGWIRAWRGGHEVITTIMLNNIALFLTRALVAGPLKDPDDQAPTTAMVDATSRMPWLFQHDNLKVNVGLAFGLIAVAGLAFWLRRTVGGYELAAAGANPPAAQAAGVPIQRVQVRAMAMSGAIAGLAGAVQALAYEGRFYSGFSPGYGFDSLGVALLAGLSPWGLIPAALGFGILNQGSTALTLIGIPRGLTGVLLGLLIIVFAALRYREVKRG